MTEFVSPRRYQGNRSQRRAFSLLEVAFALVIFVIGAIALLRIFPGGLDVLEDSGNRRVASQMSQNLLTSYTSGDLASTTPEGIYDGPNGVWNDYPFSTIGLRRQKGTVPDGPDDFTSAKDALQHIQGERQGVFNNSVYLNNIARGTARVYKEGVVSDVTIAPTGQLEFRKARYLVANRADLDANPTKLDFRQPYLDEAEGVPVSNGVITLQRGSAQSTATILWPFRLANGIGNIADITAPTTPTGTSDATVTFASTANGITGTVTVPANATQFNEYLSVTFANNANASLRRATYVIKVIGPQGESPSATPLTPSEILPIRAPTNLQGNCVYYVSSSWNNGANAAFDQPMVLPDDYPQLAPTLGVVPSYFNYSTADPVLLAPLRFRQDLGAAPIVGRTGAPVALPASPPSDADGNPSTQQITRVSVDYDVQDWEYISEDVAQFGTPFPGDNINNVDTSTPEGQAQQQFLAAAGYSSTNQMKRGNLREIRTRVGNLRGPVQIKGLYDQSAQALDITFNPRSAPQGVGTLSAAQQKAYAQQMNTLAKQGRLFLPAQTASTPPLDLSHARVYYRSRDPWAQQVAVTAPHYLPFDVMQGGQREPWREYVHSPSDRYIYFHASEAGKKVEIMYGANVGSTSTNTIEISPDVIFVSAMPAGVPANFATQKFVKPGDPRDGKFYLARSRDPIRQGTIFDIRRPTGTSGVSVRTLWLNSDRYAQEVAQ